MLKFILAGCVGGLCNCGICKNVRHTYTLVVRQFMQICEAMQRIHRGQCAANIQSSEYRGHHPEGESSSVVSAIIFYQL